MIVEHDRRTKIIWSFEDDCLSDEVAKSFAGQDFDAVRLLYQPGKAEKLIGFIDQIHEIFSKESRSVSIMLDISPPARGAICEKMGAREFIYGEEVSLTPTGGGGDIEVQTVVFDKLFSADTTIYVGSGAVVLATRKTGKDRVEAEIVQGGTVFPCMDVHVPATRPPATFSGIDKGELKKLLQRPIDFIVVPGFSDSKEIISVRDFCKQEAKHGMPWIILKLSTDAVLKKMPVLLEQVHGVLISRLELGLFVEPATIPMITKEVIETCTDQAKLVFTASEMLGSMRHNATPTRAEVSDVATAVYDGSDAVVLTEEVPYGDYSIKAIDLMRKIVGEVERDDFVEPNWLRSEPSINEEMDAVAYGAYRTAKRVGAKAIVCLTRDGNTALKLASFRTGTPIIAVTYSRDLLRKLTLVRGVDGMLLETDPLIDEVLPVVSDLLLRESWLNPSDRYVFVSVTLSSLSRQESNLFTVQTLS